MEFVILKRIFKKGFLIFWLYAAVFVCLFIPPVYSLAAEDDEDIEWLDEEDEEMVDEEKTDEKVANDEKTDKDVEVAKETDTDDEESTDVVDEESADINDEDTASVGIDDEAQEIEEETSSFADEYERSLYETYIQYYSKKVSAADWSGVVGGKDTYVVQPKDTLWDISQVLFGDSSYWPKLWSVNPSLTNPHLIQPNDNLGFIYGTEGTPPSLTVIQGGPTQVSKTPSSSPPPLPDFLKGKKITIPPKKLQPVLQNIPDSLPPLYLSYSQESELSDMNIAFKKITPSRIAFLHYYMSSEPLSGQGIVSDKKEYGSLFHVGQRIILEMREPVNPGQKLTIVKDMGKLYPSLFGVRGPFGYQIEVQGEVQIVGRVPDSFDLYEAKVTRSLNPISIGALVLNKNLIQFDYQNTDFVGNSEAQIIGVPGLQSYEKNTASPYSLVYLNRGIGNGMSVGQMYQVKANNAITRKQEYGYDIKVGEIKIIYADDRFATGLITQMNNPIRVGDYVVSLTQGLSTQQGYDPFEEVEDVGLEEGGSSDTMVVDEEDMDFKDFEDAPDNIEVSKAPDQTEEESEDDPYGDEDTFEAFE